MNDKTVNYQEIFGDVSFEEGDSSRSVLSPAAYLTDLLYLKEDIGEAGSVNSRRPDIKNISLNKDNTYSMVPNLDIANELMSDYVSTETIESDHVLRYAPYPFNAPYSLPHNKAQMSMSAALEYLKTDSHEFYNLFTDTQDVQIAARELIGLSPEEFEYICSDRSPDGEDNERYFPGGPGDEEGYKNYLREMWGMKTFSNTTEDNGNLPELQDLHSLETFLQYSMMTEKELKSLLYQNCSQIELSETDNDGHDKVPEPARVYNGNGFFINNGMRGTWSVIDESLNDPVLTIDEDTNSVDVIVETGRHSGTKQDGDWLRIVEIPNNVDGEGTYKGLAISIENVEVGENKFMRVFNQPTPDYYDRIHRFVRLARALDWTFDELDRVLMTVCNGKLNRDTISLVAVVKELKEKTNLSIEEICSLFSDVKDFGQGDTTVFQDQYNRVFNNDYDTEFDIELTDDASVLRLMSILGISHDEYEYMVETIHDDTKVYLFAYRIALLAKGLNLSVSDAIQILKFADNYKESLDGRTNFRLPIELERDSDDLVTLFTKTITGTLGEIKNLAWLIQMSYTLRNWLLNNRITIEQLDFMCSEAVGEYINGILPKKDVAVMQSEIVTLFSKSEFSEEGKTEDEKKLIPGKKIAALNVLLQNYFGHSEKTVAIVMNSILRNPGEGEDAIIINIITSAIKGLEEVDSNNPTAVAEKEKQQGLFDSSVNYLQKHFLMIEKFEFNDDEVETLFSIHRFNDRNLDLSELNNSYAGDVSVYQADMLKDGKIDAIFNAPNGNVIAIRGTSYSAYSAGNFSSSVNSGSIHNWQAELNIASIPTTVSKIDSVCEAGGDYFFFTGDSYVYINGLATPEVRKINETFGKSDNHIQNPDVNGNLNDIDASFMSGNKLYLICKDQLFRYSSVKSQILDPGFPTDLNSGLITEFGFTSTISLTAVDGVLTEGDTFYFFGDNTYVTATKNGPVSAPSIIADTWAKNSKVVSEITGSMYGKSGLHLFAEDAGETICYKYSDPAIAIQGGFCDEGYPKRLSDAVEEGWNDAPAGFKVKSALTVQTTEGEKSFLFHNNPMGNTKYISSEDYSDLREVSDLWLNGSPQGCFNSIDAAVVSENGKTYLFSGNSYIRYDGDDYTTMATTKPLNIAADWGISPKEGVTAAFTFPKNPSAGPGKYELRTFLIYDDLYAVYTIASDGKPVMEGTPQPLETLEASAGAFPKFSNVNGVLNIQAAFSEVVDDLYNLYIYYVDAGVTKLIKQEMVDTSGVISLSTTYNDIPVVIPGVIDMLDVTAIFRGVDNTRYYFSKNGSFTTTSDDTNFAPEQMINSLFGRLGIYSVDTTFHNIETAFAGENGYYYFVNGTGTHYVKAKFGSVGYVDGFIIESNPQPVSNWHTETDYTFALPGAGSIGDISEIGNNQHIIFDGTHMRATTGQSSVIATTIGKVQNNINHLGRIDAAFTANGSQFLICNGQYTRCTGSMNADLGYPKQLNSENWKSEDLGELPTIAANYTISTAIPDSNSGTLRFIFDGIDNRSTWGREYNEIQNGESIDYVITLGASHYLFSGKNCFETTFSGTTPTMVGIPIPITKFWTDRNSDHANLIPKSFKEKIDCSILIGANNFYLKDNMMICATDHTLSKATFSIEDVIAFKVSETPEEFKLFVHEVMIDGGALKPIHQLLGDTFPFQTGVTGISKADDALYIIQGDKYVVYEDGNFPTQVSPAPIIAPISRLYKDIQAIMSMSDIDLFSMFKELSKAYNKTDNSILDYLKGLLSNIDTITGWSETSELDWPGVIDNYDITSVPTLHRLMKIYHYAKRFMVSPRKLCADIWNKTYPGSLYCDGTSLTGIIDSPIGVIDRTVTPSVQLAPSEDISNLLIAGASSKERSVLLNEYGRALKLSSRNALVGVALKKRSEDMWDAAKLEQKAKSVRALKDELKVELKKTSQDQERIAALQEMIEARTKLATTRDLYAYFLTDVLMSEEAQTSRIKEATLAMQLYFHRFLMGLEESVAEYDADGMLKDTSDGKFEGDLKQWWEWMKNYRVWEANRKVFMYPENYIRPELRDTKSSQFKELEEGVLQGDNSDSRLTELVSNYLASVSKLAKLDIAGGYEFKKNGPNDQTSLFMVGRTRVEPAEYFYTIGKERIPENEDSDKIIDWQPWKKIETKINSSAVYPIYVYNRLYIFWIEYNIKDTSDIVLGDNEKPKKTYEPTIHYTYMDSSGNWATSQFMVSMYDIIYSITEDMVNAKVAETIKEPVLLANETKGWFKNFKNKLIDKVNKSITKAYDAVKQKMTDEYINMLNQFFAKPESLQTKIFSSSEEGKESLNVHVMLNTEFFSDSVFEFSITEAFELVLDQIRNTATDLEPVLPAGVINMPVESIRPWGNQNSLQWESYSFSGAGGTFLIQPESVLMESKAGYTARAFPLRSKTKGITYAELPSNWKTIGNYQNVYRSWVAGKTSSGENHDIGYEKRLEHVIQEGNELTLITDKYAMKYELSTDKSGLTIELLTEEPVIRDEILCAYIDKISSVVVTSGSLVDSTLETDLSDNEGVTILNVKAFEKDILPNEMLNIADFSGKHLVYIEYLHKDDIKSFLGTFENVFGSGLGIGGNGYPAGVVEEATEFQIKLIEKSTVGTDPDKITYLKPTTVKINKNLSALSTYPGDKKFVPHATVIPEAGFIGYPETTESSGVEIKLTDVTLPDGGKAYFYLCNENNLNKQEFRFVDIKFGNSDVDIKFGNSAEKMVIIDKLFSSYQAAGTSGGKINNPKYPFAAVDVSEMQIRGIENSGIMIFNGHRYFRYLDPIDGAIAKFSELNDAYEADKDGGYDQCQGYIADLFKGADIATVCGALYGKFNAKKLSNDDNPQLVVFHRKNGLLYSSAFDLDATTGEWILDESGHNIPAVRWHKSPGNDAYRITYGADRNICADLRDSTEVAAFTCTENDFKFNKTGRYSINRLTSQSIDVIEDRVFATGNVSSIYTKEFQFSDSLDEKPAIKQSATFESFSRDTLYVNTDKFDSDDLNKVSNGLDYTSLMSLYYTELFFHIPYLIANRLNEQQLFPAAKKWYEHVFSPLTADNKDRNYWIFSQFYNEQKEWKLSNSILATKGEQLNRYYNDPFDPHALAQVRTVAYRKAFVMAYIDNLIDWGDNLFRQYTRESLNEARMLYMLAYDLLGEKPVSSGARLLSEDMSFTEISNGSGNEETGQFRMVDIENAPVNAYRSIIEDDKNYLYEQTPNDTMVLGDYFFMPENDMFIKYWDRVEDRLFKMRHGQNIDGIKVPLPLFQTPIDPMAIVSALGSGASLSQAVSSIGGSIPHYRFNFMQGKAKELAGRLNQLGSSLLSALEKKDAESLSVLRNTYEKELLDLTLEIKEKQKDERENTIEVLKKQKASASKRHAFYSDRADHPLSVWEIAEMSTMAASQVLRTIEGAMTTAAAPLKSFGTVSVGFPCNFITTGPEKAGETVETSAKGVGIAANILSVTSSLTGSAGRYRRRYEEWKLQSELAQSEIDQIDKQITGAKVQVAIAKKEIKQVQKQIQQNESITTFMASKFTNKELYQWMASRLSGIFYQSYQLALDLAQEAQQAFRFELGLKETEVNYLTSYYWDSQKKGLLAGEVLMGDLDRMEKGYMDKNERRFEISKSVSLLDIAPEALLELKRNKKCNFTLSEKLFALDFPSHFGRQIKSISVTIPAVVGPYQNVNASLVQQSHYTLLEPDARTAEYQLFGPNGKSGSDSITPKEGAIRADWRGQQQIAVSRGVNDSGVFQLNFNDERYLPFEGTGAYSTWELELTGHSGSFDVNTISDIIINVEYTALQGGEPFGRDVISLLDGSNVDATEVFDLSQHFSTEWNIYKELPDNGLSVVLTEKMLPGISSLDTITVDSWNPATNTLESVPVTSGAVKGERLLKLGQPAGETLLLLVGYNRNITF